MKKHLAVILISLISFNSAIAAAVPKEKALTLHEVSTKVTNAWARPSAKGHNSSVYMIIANEDLTEQDELVAVECDKAEKTELHNNVNVNGIFEMVPIDNLVIPAGRTVYFQPGGLHVMLMNLKETLMEGQSFNITLTFKKFGKVSTSVKIGNQL